MKLYTRPGQAAYYADIEHPTTGKRFRFSTGETTERGARRVAQKRLQELQTEAANSAYGRRPITLGEALESYVSSIQTRPSGSAAWARALKLTGRHPAMPDVARLDPAMWLHDLTPAQLEGLALVRRDEGMAPQTIKHELALVRATTRYVFGLGFRTPMAMTTGLAKNPWRIPEVAEKTRYLSLEEFWAVYRILDPQRPIRRHTGATGMAQAPFVPQGRALQDRQDAQDLLIALAMTGGRWSEVASLTWPQVDLEAETIRIWGSKSGGEERLVPIPKIAADMLRRRFEHPTRVAQWPPRNAKDQLLVFPGRDGRQRSPSSCKAILRAMDAAGLNDDPVIVARHGKATVHSLRHTFASLLIQNGAGLADVQDALGHKTLDMTRRYAHLSKAHSTRRLGTILSGVTASET